MKPGLTIEPLTAADFPRVREIYAQGILTGEATFETEAPAWEAWDAAHLPVCRLVARSGSEILGWAALSPVSARRVYAGVAEASIYVAADARGYGIGSLWLRAVIEASERAGIWMLQSSTFQENAASLALQMRLGFRIVGRRERIACRDGRWRDTLLLERRSPVVGL